MLSETPHPFRGARKRIYDAVRNAGAKGIDVRRLFDLLYGDDPNGGPLSGNNIISVFVCQINERIKGSKQKIVAGRTGPGNHAEYRLVEIK